MIIYEKAKELAKLIEESKELDNLKRLEMEAESDGKAIELTKRYNDLYNDISEAIRNQNEGEIERLKVEMTKILDDIEDYGLTNELFKAKEEFDNMINTVNGIINHSITGNDDEHIHGDCSCCGGCN